MSIFTLNKEKWRTLQFICFDWYI